MKISTSSDPKCLNRIPAPQIIVNGNKSVCLYVYVRMSNQPVSPACALAAVMAARRAVTTQYDRHSGGSPVAEINGMSIVSL